jgi:anti-sigma B factor antagonist
VPVSFSIADSSDGPRTVVIWISGELDADTARAVRARLAQAHRHARSDVILDMSGVTFIDTVGVTAILSGAKELGPTGLLRVISPPDRVAHTLEQAGLGELFQVVPDRRAIGRDRRERDVSVEVDRRKGADRRLQNEL